MSEENIPIKCNECGDIHVSVEEYKDMMGPWPIQCPRCDTNLPMPSIPTYETSENIFALEPGEDYLVAISMGDEVTDYEREKIMDRIEQIDEECDGNLYGMVLGDSAELEDADKISQSVVQRIADRVISQLLEAGNDNDASDDSTPLGGKTHS